MGTHNVVCPVDKIKELILKEYPDYYEATEETKREMVKVFVKWPDVKEMIEYMESTK